MDREATFDLAVELLKKHEGLRLKPYRDTEGKLTIGFGRCLDTYGITPKEAQYMLMNNILECICSLVRIFEDWNSFSTNRQAALVDMVYNLGEEGFLKFKNTVACITVGDWELASKEILRSKWAKQVGDQEGQRAYEISKLLREG